MIVRSLDTNGDWNYGKGIQDYASGNTAVGQSIQTRLKSFLGDCFFAINDGLDWMNLLNRNNQLAINLAVNACILNTPNVTGLFQSTISVSASRVISITYSVTTVYSQLSGQFQFDLGSTG